MVPTRQEVMYRRSVVGSVILKKLFITYQHLRHTYQFSLRRNRDFDWSECAVPGIFLHDHKY